MLGRNNSPYVKQQYALFLQRKKKLDLAWEQIDQAYTDCKKKIFSIANTHAIIMFEKNMEIKTNALNQVNSVLQSGEYILYRGTYRELRNLQDELKIISEYI